MTVDGRPLFRPEAVEHHARGRVAPRPLDFAERRTRWAFRGLMAVTLLCVLASLTVRADLSSRGTGQVLDGGHTALLQLPAGAVGRLAEGQRVRLHLPDGEVAGHVLYVDQPRAVAGVGLVVRVNAVLDRAEPEPVGAQGTAVVRLGHPTLFALLLGRHGG
jgi:hypothetical protein